MIETLLVISYLVVGLIFLLVVSYYGLFDHEKTEHSPNPLAFGAFLFWPLVIIFIGIYYLCVLSQYIEKLGKNK